LPLTDRTQTVFEFSSEDITLGGNILSLR